jgi:glycosyltransferase involved in cell wall biosynthesis
MAEPVVSVVVPTHNRAQHLAGLVEALEAQRGVDSFEVIVVDDASTDDTRAVLERLQRSTVVPLIARRLERNRGPAAARNVGWRTARALLIAFTDDDCRPDPEWLGLLVKGLARAEIAQGRTVPDPEHASRAGPFSRTVETNEEWGFYETCNVGYRKDALARVGGFDEGFRRPFGEDTDLAWRVKSSGGTSIFERDAVVFHAVWPQSFLGHLRDLPRRAGIVRALSKNPGLRSRLPRRWFWERSHRPALLAGAGLVVLATNRTLPGAALGAALLAPYLDYRVRTQPLGRRARQPIVLAQALVADLAEIGVFATASARYRTLLL